jgi:hypothetical protein
MDDRSQTIISCCGQGFGSLWISYENWWLLFSEQDIIHEVIAGAGFAFSVESDFVERTAPGNVYGSAIGGPTGAVGIG